MVKDAARAEQEVEVRFMFGHTVHGSEGKNVTRRIWVQAEGNDSVQEVKAKISAAFGDKVLPSQLLLYFGPNEHTIGQQYLDDPAVDETALKLSQYSCLAWLRRFPHWHLSVRFLPATPPPPGVAAQRAAALSQGKDPDIAVRDARTKGEIPNLTALPKPWGPKPYEVVPGDASHLPPKYGVNSSPAIDAPLVH